MASLVIESRTRSRTTGMIVVTGTNDGKPFTFSMDGAMMKLAAEPVYFLTRCIERWLEEQKR